jgi:DNA-binding IclR family transcriptional regulator
MGIFSTARTIANDSGSRTKKPGLLSPSIQSLDRGLFILEAVARSAEPVSLGQLTDLMGIDRSNVCRLANTLKRRGFLSNPRGRKDYILGPSIWRLSRNHDWSHVLITFSREHLRRLAHKNGETAHLAVRDGKQVLFIDHCGSTNQVIVVTGRTGAHLPLYCTAHGKALLADCDGAELKAIFGGTALQRYTPRTIVSTAQLAKACAQVKAEGYALDDQEYVEGVRCLAAPIRDRDGTVLASIGISAPISRFPRTRCAAVAQEVCNVAKDISAILNSEAPE